MPYSPTLFLYFVLIIVLKEIVLRDHTGEAKNSRSCMY